MTNEQDVTTIDDPVPAGADDRRDHPDSPTGTGRRRWPWWLAVAVVAALAATVAWVWTGQSAEPATPAGSDRASEAATPTSTATVRRRDLATTESLSGTLTHADPRPVDAGLSGTITGLPEAGAVVQPGEPLFHVDGEPVVLLAGDLPQWRALSTAADDGADVAQLEQALADLGYAEGDELTVDEDFTWVTREVVEDFRAAVGLPDGGSIGMGEIVYRPGAVRVDSVDVSVGTSLSAGTTVLTTTAPQQIVTVELDTADQGLIAVEDTVTVELPDGQQIDGTVTEVADTARAITGEGQQETTSVLDVQITLAETGAGFDEAPVDVEIIDVVAEDVLAVPVEAVLALAEGGYALEVIEDGGGTNLVAVETGEFAQGWVAITGEISPGTEVVTA